MISQKRRMRVSDGKASTKEARTDARVFIILESLDPLSGKRKIDNVASTLILSRFCLSYRQSMMGPSLWTFI